MASFHVSVAIDEDERLEECRAYLSQSALLDVLKSDNVLRVDEDGEALVHKLIGYLYDRWSVIRVHCMKSLAALLAVSTVHSRETPVVVSRLWAVLSEDVTNSDRCWQELHGCLLGFIAIVDVLISSGDEERVIAVIETCLRIMPHVRIPIRDAARDCLVKIAAQSTYRTNICTRLLMTIDDLVRLHCAQSESESATLTIDGLLGTLSDLVPSICQDLSLKASADQSSKWSLPSLSLTIQQCMKHDASTVRQKAGCIVSSIVKSLLAVSFLQGNTSTMEDASIQLRFLCESILIASLKDNSLDAWQSHEVCLIVCEEVLREATALLLSSMARGSTILTNAGDRATMSILQSLAVFLQKEVLHRLVHPRYEVRRVLLQLMPTLARSQLAMLAYDSHPEHGDSNREYCSLVDGEGASQQSFGLLPQLVWLSIQMKESRHICEVLSTNLAESSGRVVIPSTELWSLEVHGRLLEVELRQEFHAQCVKIGAAMQSTGLQILLRIYLLSQREIVDSLNRFYSQLALSVRSCEREECIRFLSIDFVELFGLSCITANSIVEQLPIMRSLLLVTTKTTTSSSAVDFDFEQLSMTTAKLQIHLRGVLQSWMRLCLLLEVNMAMVPVGTLRSPQGVDMSVTDAMGCGQSCAEMAMMMILEQSGDAELCSTSVPLVTVRCDATGISLEGNLALLPSLTDPATNPNLYFETLQGPAISSAMSSSGSSKSNEIASPAHVDKSRHHHHHSHDEKHTISRHVITPTSSPSRSPHHSHCLSLSPSLKSLGQHHHFPMQSPSKSPALSSPNRVGVGCNVPLTTITSSFTSMNRWCCEAICPLLPSLASFVGTQVREDDSFKTHARTLAAIVCEWQYAALRDPLWLDNRKFARRMLFESLLPFLSITSSAVDDVIVKVPILTALGDDIAMEVRNHQKLDLKTITPLVIACSSLLQELRVICESNGLWKAAIDRQRQLCERCYRFPRDLRDSCQAFRERLLPSLDDLLQDEVRWNISSVTRLSTLDLGDSTAVAVISTSHSALSTPTLHQSEADEFSDWDEEESDDDGLAVKSDAGSVPAVSVANAALIASVEALRTLAQSWTLSAASM